MSDSEPDVYWTPGTPVDEEHALAMLNDLYAQLPALECKGKCWDSCTAIEASELERRQLAARGIRLPDVPANLRVQVHMRYGDIPRCPALTAFNTCSVYEVRPFTCRAFGLVSDLNARHLRVFEQAMMCEHRCVPEGTIDTAAYVRILDRIELLSRAVTGVIRRRTVQEEMDALLPSAPVEKKRRRR